METTNITLINGIIAFLGMALFFLIRYRNRKNKSKPFQLAYWLNDNGLELIISVITSAACFLMLDDIVFYISKITPNELPLVKVTAFLCGYANQWILKLIINPLKK
ncbi:MAG: hypothetical protein PHT69_02125 [Bacteroidales bacterium]|nr:hypothetical protein [Bacteroidales bacterium]